VRFVFPHAPVRPVTINAGMARRAWYDVLTLEGPRREDEAGIRDSARRIEALLLEEAGRGLPPARIVLAGFSQGGAMALHVGLRSREPMAGILALSSYLLLADRAAAEASPVGRRSPILMAHGTADPLIPLARARESCAALRALGCPVEWREYPMGHAVSPAEIADVAAWLEARLGPA
jgi:phospholipase/carboxylesterase